MFCYDISNPKRLSRVAKILEESGIRVQKSFFQCEMSSSKKEEIKTKLLKVINLRHDSLFIYPLCKKCAKKAITDGSGDLINLEVFQIL